MIRNNTEDKNKITFDWEELQAYFPTSLKLGMYF